MVRICLESGRELLRRCNDFRAELRVPKVLQSRLNPQNPPAERR
jgi:hypothetical protein